MGSIPNQQALILGEAFLSHLNEWNQELSDVFRGYRKRPVA